MFLVLIFFQDEKKYQSNEISIDYLKESASDSFGFIFVIIFLSLNLKTWFIFVGAVALSYPPFFIDDSVAEFHAG